MAVSSLSSSLSPVQLLCVLLGRVGLDGESLAYTQDLAERRLGLHRLISTLNRKGNLSPKISLTPCPRQSGDWPEHFIKEQEQAKTVEEEVAPM